MSLESAGGASSGGTDVLADLFYPLYQRLFDDDSDFVANLETKLAEARIPETVEIYLSKSLALGVITGVALWIVGTLLGYGLVTFVITEPPTFLALPMPEPYLSIVNSLKIPFIVIVSGLFFGSIGFGSAFGGMVAKPYLDSDARKREINVLLSDSVSFMYALSVGGLNQLEILQAMAKADDTYGEVAKEFQSIVLETEYFDTDYRTAVRNQALQTPSDELSQFLTDMLSIINSGGDMEKFLEDQKEKHMRTSKQEQEMVLETLELFGEMYMTLSLFPLLLIIILVIMSMLGEAQDMLLYGTVYGLIPLIGVGFLILVSTVVQDEVGDGYLSVEDGEIVDESEKMFDLGIAESYAGRYGIFDRIKSREGTYVTLNLLKQPHHFFRDYPLAVLAITFPASLVLLAFTVMAGFAPTSRGGLVSAPVRGTFFWLYLPLYVNFIPLTIFHEWNVRSRNSITNKLSDNLRKLSSANDTGMTLLESLKVVADTSSGRLADEFQTMHAKVNYGTSLKTALREFNNKYHIPRLARTVKLISKAQEASSQITQVLSTAAQASENQDDIERNRKSRTRMQMVIIIMTYVTLLGVMALLKVEFLDTMAGLTQQAAEAESGGGGGGGGQFGGGLDIDMLTMLFFHAVTLQGVISGFIAGYIRDVSLMAGLKYVVVLPTLALLVFMMV
ncbi:type II secretion system F family protein [Natronomonas gomsonensis]|jgi:flagellar protein FlaJ|uniref:type II secretion system F family protein n=1 Tax=Natronomonas gomsonensis TaxID=1046043 RepID=UPI0020CA89C9|nr:type II secretion system F family protein [Natronomonas gomsonensis]MCY4730173.1 type II secretion system F family protein [Natronomonas gomsonensis]